MDGLRSSPRVAEVLSEAGVAVLASVAFLVSTLSIDVDPVDRLGQISGLASLALRFFVAGALVTGGAIWAQRSRHAAHATRFACAAIAGLVGGLLAGGIVVALHGTEWGLNAQGGDMGTLAMRAVALHEGGSVPATYPPLSLHVLHWYSDLKGVTPFYAIKDLQIAGTLMFGPVAYVSWRLVLSPGAALAVGGITMLPLVDPYKPYPNLVLIAFVPLMIMFVDQVRMATQLSWRAVIVRATVMGAALGVMCLTYAGWFTWAAPGVVVCTALVVPWRSRPSRALVLAVGTAIVFIAVSGIYIAGLLFDPAGKIVDDYIYFDTRVEPLYVAMWRNDTPGVVGIWPPFGELAGVGLFTIVLAVGMGVAIARWRTSTFVLTLGCIVAGAWFMRFFYARAMWETKLVQLYPRTTPVILCCLLALGAIAACQLLRGRRLATAGLCASLLLFGSAGSAIADRYMPLNTDPHGPGWFSLIAHITHDNLMGKQRAAWRMYWRKRPVTDSESPNR